MKPRVFLTAIIAAGLLLEAGCGKPSAEKPTEAAGRPVVAVETVAVAPSDVTDGVEVVGSLAAKFQAEVKSEITGRVAEVYVTEWARVRKGDPLARIDTSETEVILRKAKAVVQAARAARESASAAGETARANGESARAAAATAGASLAEAKVAAERADREYDRLVKLKETGLVTQQAVDEGRTVRDAAEARVRTVETQVAASESQVRAAEAQVKVAESQVRAAEAQVAVNDEDVLQAETRLGKAIVRAPFDGAVAERLVNVGEVVGEMQKVIFRLVDNRRLELTVNVPSARMASLRVGQPLTFTVDALPGRTFTGTVSFINPEVNVADRSVKVVAEVPNPGEELKGGLFATGFIVTGTRPNVLRVPRAALVNWDTAAGKGDLYVVEGDAVRRVTVTVGAASGDLAEIVDGLQAGARVVVRGGFNLKDGDRVRDVTGGRG